MLSDFYVDYAAGQAALRDPYTLAVIIGSLMVASVSWIMIKSSLVEYRLPKLSIVLADKIQSAKQRSREYTNNSSEVLNIGYRKFPNEPFGLSTTEGTSIVIPLRYLDYMRGQKALSFSAFLDEEFAFKPYTKLGNLDPEEITVLIKKVNPTLPEYTPVLQDLVQKYWPLEKFDSYQSVKLYSHVHLMTSRICARVFHGDDAAGNDKWLHIATNYIHLAMDWTARLREWPIPLRPLIYRWVTGWDDLVREWADARAIITETSLSATVMQSLIDIATYPEFVPELREEIQRVMNNYNGEITKQGLSDMLKLDSFIKETGRLNPPDLTSFQRKATADLKLSNGMFLPKGAKLMLPSVSVNMDEALYQDPAKFDGFRFYKIRTSKPENRTSHQHITVGKKDIAWGYGAHACPGRFMADVGIKLVLIEFIMNYDLRTPKDVVGRPKNIEVEGVSIPDPQGELLIKRADWNRS
ncbi:cytochrome P450 [Ilyonectria destructans]|nr:cytochrome P450 [Ilyonectria destructans]